MAWQHTLYDASFRGVSFEYFGVDDSQDKSLAQHQGPYTNGATIFDMGNNPKHITMTALVAGVEYEQALESLLIALDAQGSGELMHPILGALEVFCASYRVKHDSDIVDGCTVEMQFISHLPAMNIQHFTPEPMPTNAAQADSLILEKPSEALSSYQEQLMALDTEAAQVEARLIPEQIRSKLREVRTALGTNLVRMDDLLSPPSWLGSIVGDVDMLVKMLPLDYDPMSNWRRLFNRVKALGNVFDDGTAQPLQRLGQVLPAVMLSRGVITILTSEQQSPTLTPSELIAIKDEARQQIQEAIEQIRADSGVQNDHDLPVVNTDITPVVQDLKKAAAQLQRLTEALINRRPPLIQHRVTVPCSWRLLAHRLYGDHSRSEELARLNRGLVDASVIEAGTQVAAYAS